MANNRGGIPMYNENPQYSATISSQLPQGSPAMFGTQVAKERAGLGDAMVKLGTNVVDWAVKMQERDDNAFILEKDNQMRQAMTDLLYNPQTGLANQKGKNSFGVTQTYDEEIEKLTQNAMSEIGSPVLQAKLQEHNMQWVNSLRTTIAKHEGGERFTYYSNQMSASSLHAQNFGLQIGGLEGMQASIAMRAGLRDTGKSLLGWDDTMADNWEREENSKTFSLIAKDFIDRGNIGGLQSLVDAYGDKVTGAALTDAKSKLRVITQQQDAAKMAEQLIAEHPELIDEDGNLDEAKYAELVDQLNGENAADRIERVLVGGGSNDRFVNIAQKTAEIIRQKYPDASPNLAAYLYGQMRHETGNFTHDRALANNNFAGLHGGADGKHYANDDEYIKDYASFFTEGYHTNAIYAESGMDFARRLSSKEDGGSGWYTSRNYKAYGNTIEEAVKEFGEKSAAGGVEPYQMPTQGASIDEQVGNLKDTWKHGVMDWVGGVVKDVFRYSNPTISSAARSSARNAQVSTSGDRSWHVHNDALDVVFDEGQNLTQEQKDALVKYFKDTGMFEEVLYHNYGSGWHLHLGGLKSSNPPQGGGSHYEERRVSGYNPVLNSAMKAYGKRKADMIKGENERKITTWANALFENPNVINARDQSEIDVEMDKMGIPRNKRAKVMARVNYSMSVNNSRVSRERSDESYDRTKKTWREQDASDKLAGWMRNNPNATTQQVLEMGDQLGISNKEYIAIRDSKGGAGAKLKNAYAWAKDPNNEKAFNDTISGLKLNSLQKANIRIYLNNLSEERMGKNEPPLTDEDIIAEVKKKAGKVVINKGTTGIYGGEEITEADLPPGAERTEYGVLLNGYTMAPVRDDNGTIVDWKVMNAD